eukprot:gene15360-17180_t
MSEDNYVVALNFGGEDSLPDWEKLSLEEIYDFLNPLASSTEKGSRKKLNDTCIAKIGCTANALIKEMVVSKYLDKKNQKMQKVLRNSVRDNQRKEFCVPVNGKIEFVRTFLAERIIQLKDTSGEAITKAQYTANLLARVIMLIADENSLLLLQEIFRGPAKESQRLFLDNKDERTIGKWRAIADEYFNNQDWRPENALTYCTYVSDLDPSQCPESPWSPESLRSTFSKLRTEFTIIHSNYHRSGHLQEGFDHGEGDDLFWMNYAQFFDDQYEKGYGIQSAKKVFMFMRLTFREGFPTFVTRELADSIRMDIGVSNTTRSAPNSAKKIGVTNEGFKDGLKEALKLSEEERKYYVQKAAATKVQSNLLILSKLEDEIEQVKHSTTTEDVEYYQKLIGKKRKLMLDLTD